MPVVLINLYFCTPTNFLYSERCRVDRIEELYLNNMEEELHELLVDKDLENKDINI